MKKSIILVCILCLSLSRLYAYEPEWENEKERKPDKVESKAFSSVGEIVFDQKYGNIQIVESITNEVQLEIRYFYGRKNNIPVCEVQQSGKSLQIRTVEGGKDNSKIDYIISVPKDVNMTIGIKYGNVESNNYYGLFNMTMDYGNLTAGTFYKDVFINGKYSNFTISNVGLFTLDCGYSNIDVKKINKLDAKSKYSNFKIADVNEMNLTASYGGVTLDNVSVLNLDLKYTDTSIKKLIKSLNADCSYSDMSVKETDSNLESIYFTGKYSDISLTPNTNICSEIEFSASYGDIKIPNSWYTEYKVSEEKNNSSYRKGILGKGTPKTKMKITTSYGDITIK